MMQMTLKENPSNPFQIYIHMLLQTLHMLLNEVKYHITEAFCLNTLCKNGHYFTMIFIFNSTIVKQ